MSGITFKIGTTLYLTTDTHRYKLLVGEVTASQTFSESRQSLKTLHKRTLVDKTFTTEKSPVSLGFSIHLGAGEVEKALANWFGLPFLSNTTHNIPTFVSLDAAPSTSNVYIVGLNGTVYKVSSAVGENISFTITQKEILAAKVTATGSDLQDITEDPTEMSLFNGLTEVAQTSSGFTNSSVVLTGFNNVLGVTMELTRGISWLSQKSLFDIGSIYKVQVPAIDTFTISGSITQIKLNNNKNTLYDQDKLVDIHYGPSFNAKLSSCSTTERLDLGDYHRIATDYVLLPSSVNSTLKF
jgi:hypothetical protein